MISCQIRRFLDKNYNLILNITKITANFAIVLTFIVGCSELSQIKRIEKVNRSVQIMNESAILFNENIPIIVTNEVNVGKTLKEESTNNLIVFYHKVSAQYSSNLLNKDLIAKVISMQIDSLKNNVNMTYIVNKEMWDEILNMNTKLKRRI